VVLEILKMRVTTLRTDLWEGVRCKDGELLNPSWLAIECAIKNLDGEYRTIASIEGTGAVRLVVGGGAQGKYIVWVTFDDTEFHTLLSSDRSAEKTLLRIGGQDGDYEKEIIVDVNAALKAAKTFYEFGKLDEELKWKS
jgi:Immunity protein Imm1